MTIVTLLFWISLTAIFYAYIGYPLALLCLLGFRSIAKPIQKSGDFQPPLSIIIPAHNEGKVLEKKIRNTLALQYPEEKREILIISDGSTDNTATIAENFLPHITFHELEERGGKAAALNRGIELATHEIVVFSDASIMLEPDALQNIISKFRDTDVGCISGEDHIRGMGGEGLYGRYELTLRNLESNLYSIVGASGSFYAQRKQLCYPFKEGLAPDFLSVLNTVEQGYRAITEPSAIGYMSAVQKNKDEFSRKVRTIVRGMTVLFHKRQLLNPLRFGLFSFSLISHKLVRWLVPFFLIITFFSNALLIGQPFYLALFFLQTLFYLLAFFSFYDLRFLHASPPARICNYFLLVNLAALLAWWRYLSGTRQEIWTPSRR